MNRPRGIKSTHNFNSIVKWKRIIGPMHQVAPQPKRRNIKLVEFAPRSSQPPVITQRDLTEEIFLANEALRALKALKEKRKEICRKLQEGAEIERGIHDAALMRKHTRNGSISYALHVR